MTATARLLSFGLILLSGSSALAAGLLRNGDFTEWQTGGPVGWTVVAGAGQGPGPTSGLDAIRPATGPGEDGIRLSGDGSTRVWQAVYQDFPAHAGRVHRLAFSARARDIRLEAGQYDNRYIALSFLDGEGRVAARRFHPIQSPDWAEGVVALEAPPDTAVGRVMLFLSQSGTLDIRGLSLGIDPGGTDSFATLSAEMARHYSQFALRGVDWAALTAEYRSRAESAATPDAFADTVRAMLARLGDAHVWVQAPGGPVQPTHVTPTSSTFHLPAVRQSLAESTRIGDRTALVGLTAEGFGYLAIGTLHGPAEEFDRAEEALRGLLDCPGLIVDLRANGGGEEARGRRLAALLARQAHLYGRSLIRSGPRPEDLAEQPPRWLEPAGPGYDGPVAVLTGPACLSSGESFVMMLKALPNAFLVGLPTQGASGNPGAVTLPNGVTVYFSRWVNLLPDGTAIETRGVPPDIRVEPDGPGDPTLTAARAELRRRLTR